MAHSICIASGTEIMLLPRADGCIDYDSSKKVMVFHTIMILATGRMLHVSNLNANVIFLRFTKAPQQYFSDRRPNTSPPSTKLHHIT